MKINKINKIESKFFSGFGVEGDFLDEVFRKVFFEEVI